MVLILVCLLRVITTEDLIRLKRQVEYKSSRTLLNTFSTFSSTKLITSVIFSLLGEGGQPKQLSPPVQAHQAPLGLFTRLGRGGVILSCKASG